jgi:hypothetical protein
MKKKLQKEIRAREEKFMRDHQQKIAKQQEIKTYPMIRGVLCHSKRAIIDNMNYGKSVSGK